MAATVTAPERTEALRRRYARRARAGRVGLYVLAVLAAIVCAGPFVWSAITALKLNADLYTPENNPFLFNDPATLDHVLFLFTDTAFPTFLWNTLWVGVLVVAITLVFGLPAAYSLARLDRPWSGPMGITLFFVYLVPPTLLFLSLTRIVVGLGLQDSTWSLVVIYPTITIPICTWLLIGFLKGIPRTREKRWRGESRVGRSSADPAAPFRLVAVIVFASLNAASHLRLAFSPPAAEKVVSRRTHGDDPRRRSSWSRCRRPTPDRDASPSCSACSLVGRVGFTRAP